ncbi:MAG: M28 family peptidase [bacterium]|nr:M28 family peptidase [bacterium]
MHRTTIIFLLLLLLPAGVFAELPATNSALVFVNGSEETGLVLNDQGVMLACEVADGFLAFLDTADLAALRAWSVDHHILDPLDDGSRDYFVVFGTDRSTPATAQLTDRRTLRTGRGYRVVSIPADASQALAGYPDLQRVFRRPLRFVRIPWNGPKAGRAFDPVIPSLLDGVAQSDLEATVQHLQDFGTRHSEEFGGYLASIWIRDQFLAYGYSDVGFHDYNSWNDNVVCVKPGSVYPDRYMVLGGHYDSTSNPSNHAPGADDNATGTAGVLAAARLMADTEFEYSIIFIAFSGEEEGLVGSDCWASEAAAAGMDIVAMVNLDMLGYVDPGDAADIDIISDTASEPLRDLAFDAIATYVPELPAIEGYLSGASSDHASFWSSGYRAIFLFEDAEDYCPYIHTVDDVIGLGVNSFPFMFKNVKAAIAIMAVLAQPFHIAIVHEPLEHSEELGPFAIDATVHSTATIDQSSVQLHYRINGGPFNTRLLDPVDGDRFTGAIPVQIRRNHLEYYLTAANTDGSCAASPAGAPADLHEFRVGVENLFVDDCETDQGWTLGAPGDDATSGLWVRADPVGTAYQPEDDHTADPGTICFVTGNAAPGDITGANDVDGGGTTLLSPIFDLSATTWAGLSYWRWFADGVVQDDDFRVDVSNDGGGSWQRLEVVADDAYPWVKAEFDDLGAIIALTDRMQLRFVAQDVNEESLVEACIDDLRLVVASSDATGIDGSPEPAALLENWPNPFNPLTTINYRIPREGLVEIRIFDAAGAEIARPLSGHEKAGSGHVVWNAGSAPSGIYMARLTLDGRPLRGTKLTLLK